MRTFTGHVYILANPLLTVIEMVVNPLKTIPELSIAAAMLGVMLIISVAFGLPVVFPSGQRAAFVGIHYVYPLIGVGLLGIVTFVVGDRRIAHRFMIALPCYAVVLFAHFNIKLWIPHINPTEFDDAYWALDQTLWPIVEGCKSIRRALTLFVPYGANFYMISFIAMFYISFIYHAIRTPHHFGKLAISVLLMQSFGTIAYLIAPAVGPFIYEAGVNPIVTQGQQGMLEFYRNSVATGPGFLAKNGSANFTAGLAAMPSLHSAGACLFFLFAWRHGRVLLPLYSFILMFIFATAIANRWHYVIDIPIGACLAWVSYKLADLVTRRSETELSMAHRRTPEQVSHLAGRSTLNSVGPA